MTSVYVGFAVVALLAMPAGASRSPSPSQGRASCPVTLPLPNALPRGARLLGAAPTASPLHYVSVTDQSPAQVRSDGDYLAEIEGEVDDNRGVRRDTTAFDSTANPVSLVCRYGGSGKPGRNTAMLLVPLPANIRGQCVTTSLLRGGGQIRPRITCMRSK